MDAWDLPPMDSRSRRIGGGVACCAAVGGGVYVLLIVAAMAAIVATAVPGDWEAIAGDRQLWHALRLSLVSASVATALALAVGVPLGCAMARGRFRGRTAIGLLLDVPLVVPPVVLGFGLLAALMTPAGRAAESGLRSLTESWLGEPLRIAYNVPAVVLAQFLVAAALAERGARVAFERLDHEAAAAPRGRDRRRGAGRSLLVVALVTWARAVGEFGPVLIAADAIALKTEVLPTTIYIELKSGELKAAAAAALLLVVFALIVLLCVRMLGGRLTCVAVPTLRGK